MSDPHEQLPRLCTRDLPDSSQTDASFRDTSFFKVNNDGTLSELPSPEEVLTRSQGSSIVKFDHLNLIVKYGPSHWVDLEEAKAMIAVRRAFPYGEFPKCLAGNSGMAIISYT